MKNIIKLLCFIMVSIIIINETPVSAKKYKRISECSEDELYESKWGGYTNGWLDGELYYHWFNEIGKDCIKVHQFNFREYCNDEKIRQAYSLLIQDIDNIYILGDRSTTIRQYVDLPLHTIIKNESGRINDKKFTQYDDCDITFYSQKEMKKIRESWYNETKSNILGYINYRWAKLRKTITKKQKALNAKDIWNGEFKYTKTDKKIKKVKYQDKKDKEAFDILTQRINDCKTADELNEVLDWIETIKWEYDQFVDVGDQIAEWHFKHDAYKKTTTIHYIVTEWHGIEAVLYDDSIDWLIDSYPIDKNGNRIE